MRDLIQAWATWTFSPLKGYQDLWGEFLRIQSEQGRAVGRFLAGVAGVPLAASGSATPRPRHADLYAGKRIAHTKTFTDAGTLLFGFLSSDFNPLHFNEVLAGRTRFGGRIAHGFHTASMFSGVLAELCPCCVYLRQEMEFTAPVRPGDRITAVGTIEGIDAKGVVSVALECRNDRGEAVVRGRALLKKLKELYGSAPSPVGPNAPADAA
ncbi:MAG: MaoC family dehydratase [Candidatus Methylomirabilales bacterium]